jgi:2-iminobutanoate/2-iminopropanoate deaminase
MTPKRINSDKAPGAVGAYSQAMSGGNFIFTSGQLPIDPATKVMPEDIKEQAALALKNLRNILQAGGSDLADVLKTTVYLADIKDFPAVNEVYATFFSQPFPARSCFAVKELPLGAKIEIEAVALTR